MSYRDIRFWSYRPPLARVTRFSLCVVNRKARYREQTAPNAFQSLKLCLICAASLLVEHTRCCRLTASLTWMRLTPQVSKLATERYSMVSMQCGRCLKSIELYTQPPYIVKPKCLTWGKTSAPSPDILPALSGSFPADQQASPATSEPLECSAHP